MTEKRKIKENFSTSQYKNSKPFFVSKVLSRSPSARLEKICWPVTVVKEKQKYSKICKF